MSNTPKTIYLTREEYSRLKIYERRYRQQARRVFTNRVAYYHQFTGGHYTSITIRDQKSRWGSCSSRGTLSFNYRLVFAPPKVLDYVVVHELCHLTHMNHSKDFWDMVERIMPDYQIHKQWLREHEPELTLTDHLAKQGIPIKL
ncbi:MAG: M48 family metallopeptidase [Lachnospiraceae bacterium]|nr:M48 family metallopeptidase [Lachnospiraceae bacterium]